MNTINMKFNKVLVLSCNTGEGHNSCAKALKAAFELDDVKCDVRDTLSLLGVWFSKMISNLYELSVSISLFGHIYRASEWYSNLKRKPKSIVYHLNKLYAKKLLGLLLDGGYEAVVCTHPFPALAMTYLKKRHDLKIPTFFVATDYTCYPYIDETDLDGYMIAHQDLKEEYTKKGISENKIYVIGIPSCDAGCKERISQFEARKSFDTNYMSYSGRWFLLMGGSMGFGNMNELVCQLLKRCGPIDRIICVCGKNGKLKNRIDKAYCDTDIVKTIAYTDMIKILMAACDVIFTKPGGLTSTESLHSNIPIIHTFPIKGVEDKNAMFFHRRGMSFSSDDVKEQIDEAFLLCDDTDRREAMLFAQRNNAVEKSSQNMIEIMKKYCKQL